VLRGALHTAWKLRVEKNEQVGKKSSAAPGTAQLGKGTKKLGKATKK
jgi:hypothetical protein